MKLYGLKNCDTCRAALKALKESGKDVEFVDVRATPPGEAFLAQVLAAHGDAVVNKRSTTWRGLSETERAMNPVTLLSNHPSLMKRPVILDGETLHLGWTADVQAATMG
ncbi:MAG: ArsC/Spx/MgsR family protein [Pseudomonadota bacterium]